MYNYVYIYTSTYIYAYICMYIYTYTQVSPLFRSKVQEWASVGKSFFPAKPAPGEEGGGLVNWQEAMNDASLRNTIAWPAGRFSRPFWPLFFKPKSPLTAMFTALNQLK